MQGEEGREEHFIPSPPPPQRFGTPDAPKGRKQMDKVSGFIEMYLASETYPSSRTSNPKELNIKRIKQLITILPNHVRLRWKL